jgi:hypothetical protein
MLAALLEAVGNRGRFTKYAWEVIEDNPGFITVEDDDEIGATKVVMYIHHRGHWRRRSFTVCSNGDSEINLVTGGRTTSVEVFLDGYEDVRMELVIEEVGRKRWWYIYVLPQPGTERSLLGGLKTWRIPLHGATLSQLAALGSTA